MLMDPNAQYPQYQPPAPQGNPYDYILNSPQGKRRAFVPGGKHKKLFSVLFVLFVLLIVVVVISLFNSLTSKDYSAYISLAQKQNEVARIAEIGATNGRSSYTKQYATTIKMTLTSEQSSTVSYLNKNGKKLGDKQLSASRNSDTDKKLTASEQTSTYDDTYNAILNSLVKDYYASVKSATSSPSGLSEKALATTLQNDYKILTSTSTSPK